MISVGNSKIEQLIYLPFTEIQDFFYFFNRIFCSFEKDKREPVFKSFFKYPFDFYTDAM